MYKLAVKLKLRFATSKGSLSIEQIQDLSLEELNSLAIAIEDEYKKSGKKSFITKKSTKDKEAKLKLDILLDIINDKLEERDEASVARANKEHNQKILAQIERAKDKELEGKSVEELEAMLKR